MDRAFKVKLWVPADTADGAQFCLLKMTAKRKSKVSKSFYSDMQLFLSILYAPDFLLILRQNLMCHYGTDLTIYKFVYFSSFFDKYASKSTHVYLFLFL